jgi:hypothetical protein
VNDVTSYRKKLNYPTILSTKELTTGEFSGHRSSVDEDFNLLGYDNASVSSYIVTLKDEFTFFPRNVMIHVPTDMASCPRRMKSMTCHLLGQLV